MNGWGKRPRWVYGYNAIDLRGQEAHVRVAYVGKTSSKLYYRNAQHRNGKVWAWAIVGEIYPIWHGECGRVSLWLREVWYIHRLKPMFNVEHNKGNHDRITPWQAKRLYDRSDRPFSRDAVR